MDNQNLLVKSDNNWKVFSGNVLIENYSVKHMSGGISATINTGEAPFCLLSHRFVVVQNQDLFEMSADIFLEKGCEEGGVSLRASFIDKNGNWNGYSESASVTSCGEWFTVKKTLYGIVTEKCLFEIVVKGKNVTANLKNCRLEKIERKKNSAKKITSELSVSKYPFKNLLQGFGAEADPEFFSGKNAEIIPDLDEQWQLLENRMKEMALPFVRMMLLPHIFEPEKGVITLETDGCRQLFRYLDIFQKLNIRVILTWWCVAREDMPWLAYPAERPWCSPPNDSMHAAESLAIFLKKLVEEKGYTCIKDIILMNEPNESYVTDKGVDFEHYAEFYRNFDACLKKQGIREKFALIGSDDTGHIDWLKKCTDNIDDVLDGYSTHVYRWNFYDNNLDKIIEKYIDDRSSLTEKPFIVGEFGQETRTNYVLEAVEYGLFLAAFAINALKGGACGASYWTLFDVYYGQQMMGTGLWAYYDEDWKIRPAAVTWKMLNKYTTPGDKIYSIDGFGADAIMFSSDNGYTIALLNRSEDIVNVTIKNLPEGEISNCLIFNADVWKKGKKEPEELEFKKEKDEISCIIPPESFVIMATDGRN